MSFESADLERNELTRRSSRNPSGRLALAAICILALVPFAGPAEAYSRPGRTARANLTPAGDQSGKGPEGAGCELAIVSARPTGNCSGPPVISENGRYVAFSSWADDLVAGDLVGPGVFRRDLRKQTTELVSVGSDGLPAIPEVTTGSHRVAMSADGRYVAFGSAAPNLASAGEDLNGVVDLYLRDMEEGRTVRVTAADDGGDSNGTSGGNASFMSLSGNGRFIAFQSDASNLVDGDTNGVDDVFIRDLVKGVTQRVSVGHDGTEADGPSSGYVSISPTGRYVVFGSEATNLVPGDTNGVRDAFLFDRQRKITERLSVRADGSEVPPPTVAFFGLSDATGTTGRSISSDGRFVVFRSSYDALVPNDSNLGCDTFVRDRKLDRTQRISVTSDGEDAQGGCSSSDGSITPDGRFVVLNTTKTLVPDEAGDCLSTTPPIQNGQDGDIFLYDLHTGAVDLVSRSSAGAAGRREDGQCSGSTGASISSDARWVAFSSSATNLVGDDTNGYYDIFVRDRGHTLSGNIDDGGKGNTQPADAICLPVIGCVGWPAAASVADSKPAVSKAESGGDRGDLAGLTLAYRPQLGDLFLRLDVQPMGISRSQGLLYGARLRVEEVRYEVRAQGLSFSGLATGVASFGLFRCTGATCDFVSSLKGGYGTMGDSVVATIPLHLLDLGVDRKVEEVIGFSAMGTYLSGASSIVDRVRLRPTGEPPR